MKFDRLNIPFMKKTAFGRMAVHVFLLGMIALFMANCSTHPTHLELVIHSSKNLNPDRDNISSPLMLNFYELKDAEQFSKLDFWTLVDEGSDRLSNDLISQAKHVIVPNQEQTYKIIFDENAKFLGIIGSFREVDNNTTWRYIKNLDVQEHNSVELAVDNYTIEETE